MAERTVITELCQVFTETTYGTSGAATRRLASMGIDLSPEFETTRIRPMGFKVDSIVAPMREWASGDLSGYPTYNEIIWPLSSVLKAATPSTTTGVTTWTFDWSPTSVETVKSFTIEQGDAATRAHKVTGALVTDLNLEWTRTGDPTLGGKVLAQAFTDGITPTSSLTASAPIPILPTHIDVFSDALYASIGTTKLTRVVNAGFSIGGMWGPLWVLNTSNSSFVTTVQNAPDVTFKLTLEADSSGNAYFTQMRAGTAVMLQLKATGPNISGGTPTTAHSFTVNFVGTIEGAPKFGDEGGVRTAEWSFRNTYDATSGKALVITVVNGQATLT